MRNVSQKGEEQGWRDRGMRESRGRMRRGQAAMLDTT